MSHMQQMPLALKPPRRLSFENYIGGENQGIIETLNTGLEVGDWYLLVGPHGSGRSHLMSAVFQHLSEQGQASAYVPLSDAARWPLLDQINESFVVIDDVDALAADPAGEMYLFNALNRWRIEKATVVMSAASLTDFVLPDLCSRLGQATRLTLKPLQDVDFETLVMRLARDQEIDMPPEVAKYLVSRVRRNAGDVTRLVNQVLLQALSERRSITIPMVRSLLQLSGE